MTEQKIEQSFIDKLTELKYTYRPDITDDNAAAIEHILPKENLLGFHGAYLETALRLKAQQGKRGSASLPRPIPLS